MNLCNGFLHGLIPCKEAIQYLTSYKRTLRPNSMKPSNEDFDSLWLRKSQSMNQIAKLLYIYPEMFNKHYI